MLARPLLTLVPGSRRVSGSPYAWDCRMWWNGLYSIPTQQLETRLGPGGGKKGTAHKRFIIWTRQQKRAVRTNMGKSITSECVIQILSWPQKYEQVLKFPTHILSARYASFTAHKRFDAAWGPCWGNYLFIAPAEWPWLADWAVSFSLADAKPWTEGPWAPGLSGYFSGFVSVRLPSAHLRSL